jgi:hypothetical protein
VLIVMLCVASLAGAGKQVRLEQAAAQAARFAARGEPSARVHDVAARILAGVHISVHPDGDIVCVEARATSGAPLLPALRTTACAAAGGL